VLAQQLDRLTPLHGRATIERWNDLAQHCEWDELVGELLERHYDPAYTRSITSNYTRLPEARALRIAGVTEADLLAAARVLLEGAPAYRLALP
jgi:tRNA 2-selenouridine synthase